MISAQHDDPGRRGSLSWKRQRRLGQRDARLYLSRRAAIRTMKLSRYGEGRLRDRLLRGLLLLLSVPPGLLAPGFRLLSLVGSRASALQQLLPDYAYWFGARLMLRPAGEWERVRGSGVPILLYHRITKRRDPADPKYSLTRSRFKAQMRLLRLLGYQTLSLRDLVRCHTAGELPPTRSVVITFDDGYRDNAAAARLMLAHGQSGTIFLVTGCIGGERTWSLEGLGRLQMLSWDEVCNLKAAGFDFGSHTRSHPDLGQLNRHQAAAEIRDGRSDILRELGDVGHLFAYPYGSHNAAVKSLVAEAGYSAACGVYRGLSNMHDDLYCLRRVNIYGDENLVGFLFRLLLGDNPLDFLPWGRAAAWYEAPRS